MKPHPRMRKTIKWGGAAVTVLLVVVWVVSRWTIVGWAAGSVMIQASEGCLDIALPSKPIPPQVAGWHAIAVRTPQFQWWYWIDKDLLWGNWRGMFPLWWAVAPIFIVTFAARYFDARVRGRVRRCPKCGYDRTGLVVGAASPECGAATCAESSALSGGEEKKEEK